MEVIISYTDKESIYLANFWIQNNESFTMSDFSSVTKIIEF